MSKSEFAFMVLALCSGSAYAQIYDARALPPRVVSTSINNSGYVSGIRGPEAVLIDPSNHLEVVSPPLVPGVGYTASDISASSLIAATRDDPMGIYAVLLRLGSPPIDIGVLPGNLFSTARKVNDSGVVVGYSYGGASERLGFAWVPNLGTIESGTLHPLQCTDASLRRVGFDPYSIAPTQPLIGGSCAGVPALWWYGGIYDLSWMISNFEIRRTMQNAYCRVADISTNLNFIISCELNVGGAVSVIYNWARGTFIQFENASLVAVNDQGCAVGTMRVPFSSEPNRAVRACTDIGIADGIGSVIDLSTVTSDDLGIYNAVDINERGQILAYGYQTYVLTPR